MSCKQIRNMVTSNKKDNELLQKIANHLIINSSFLDNLGLFHGKMGIVIFFYHYARYTNNPLYEEFAGELLDEIFEEIHDKLPIDFENGYLGIGWGIEYLAEQKFIEGDTNDILQDIDKKVMERDIRRITDLSLNTGLEGIFHYVLARLRNNENNIDQLFDKQYLSDLIKVTNQVEIKSIPESLILLVNEFHLWTTTLKQLSYSPVSHFSNFCYSEMPHDNNIYEWKLGLKNECAGVGLKLMIYED